MQSLQGSCLSAYGKITWKFQVRRAQLECKVDSEFCILEASFVALVRMSSSGIAEDELMDVCSRCGLFL